MKSKIKAFFTSNILLKVLSVFLGFLIWALLSNTQDPIVTKSVSLPIKYLNADLLTDEDLVFLSGPETFSVTVSVRRSKQANVNSSMFSCTADLTDHIGGEVDSQRVHVTVKQVGGTDSILDWSYQKNDPNITVALDNFISKEFPIELQAEDSLTEGLILENSVSFDPAVVTVSGPASYFGSLASVKAPVRLSELTDAGGGAISTEVSLKLYNANANEIRLSDELQISHETATMYATIERLQTVNVIVAGTVGTPKEGYRYVSSTVTPSQISVQGLKSTVIDLTEIYIPAEMIDISNISRKTEYKIPISSILPEGVTLSSSETELKVVIDVELWETKQYAITQEQVTFEGAKEEYEYSLASDVLLLVKGFEEDLAVLDVTKFEPSVQVWDLKPGTHRKQILIRDLVGYTVDNSDSIYAIVYVEEKESEEDEDSSETKEASTKETTSQETTAKEATSQETTTKETVSKETTSKESSSESTSSSKN